jgi:hypothetical protein
MGLARSDQDLSWICLSTSFESAQLASFLRPLTRAPPHVVPSQPPRTPVSFPLHSTTHITRFPSSRLYLPAPLASFYCVCFLPLYLVWIVPLPASSNATLFYSVRARARFQFESGSLDTIAGLIERRGDTRTTDRGKSKHATQPTEATDRQIAPVFSLSRLEPPSTFSEIRNSSS